MWRLPQTQRQPGREERLHLPRQPPRRWRQQHDRGEIWALNRNPASGYVSETEGIASFYPEGKVDIKSGTYGKIDLNPEDFSATGGAVDVVVGGIPDPGVDDTWSDGFLDAAGLARIKQAGNTQLRLYFPIDDNDNGAADYIVWYSGESADRPTLTVTYSMP
jgi:hypothetical protein